MYNSATPYGGDILSLRNLIQRKHAMAANGVEYEAADLL